MSELRDLQDWRHYVMRGGHSLWTIRGAGMIQHVPQQTAPDEPQNQLVTKLELQPRPPGMPDDHELVGKVYR